MHENAPPTAGNYGIFVAFFLLSFSPAWRPTPMTEKYAAPCGMLYIGLAAGKEVVSSMVRASPCFSWAGGASMTPNGAKEQQCCGSTFLRVLFQ